MNDHEMQYQDLLEAPIDPRRKRLIDELHAIHEVALPAPVRASIARALEAEAREPHRRRPRRLPWATPLARTRAAAVAAVAALALGGGLGYLRLQGPDTVSAAAVLQRALTAPPTAAPGQAIHETGTLYVNGAFDLPDQRIFTPPMTVQVEQWTELNADGTIARQATILTDSAGKLVARGLQIGRQEQVYGALQDAVSSGLTAPDDYAWLANPLGIGDVPALLAAAQTNGGDLRLLPQQTVAGTTADVVQITTGSGDTNSFPHPLTGSDGRQVTTMYVDARSYAILGVDVATVAASGATTARYSVRVSHLDVVPQAAVPAGTFALDAPPTARYLPAQRPTGEAPASEASAPRPTLLLAAIPDGLQLSGLNRDLGSDYSVTSIIYCATEHCNRLPALPAEFTISFAQARPPSPSLPPLLAEGQQMTLTIAGQARQAYYLQEDTPLGAHRLIYQDGLTVVELYSRGLSTADFLAAAGSLVDAQSHPELIPAKWRAAGEFGPRG